MQAADPTGAFSSSDGTRLFARWTGPASASPGQSPRASIVIVHGYGEHSGRYEHVAKRLAAAGFAVLLFDYRGHGHAAGPRGHCDRFEEYFGDLASACDQARARSPEAPLVLVGHSHGGLIVLRALAEPGRRPAGVVAATVSSPFLGLAIKVPALKVAAARLASKIHPKLALPNGIAAADISRDVEVITAYMSDPLNHHVATARWFTEAQAAQAYVAEHADRITIPMLWQIGGADRIADPEAAKRAAARAGGDKQVIVYDGLYHEIFNELAADRARVLDDLVGWLEKRFPAAS